MRATIKSFYEYIGFTYIERTKIIGNVVTKTTNLHKINAVHSILLPCQMFTEKLN